MEGELKCTQHCYHPEILFLWKNNQQYVLRVYQLHTRCRKETVPRQSTMFYDPGIISQVNTNSDNKSCALFRLLPKCSMFLYDKFLFLLVVCVCIHSRIVQSKLIYKKQFIFRLKKKTYHVITISLF